MHSKGNSQAKIEIIYKLLNTQQTKENTHETVQFHYNTNIESLRAINQNYDLNQKIPAYTILSDKYATKQLYDVLTDAGGLCLNSLIKGHNVALVTYGPKGRGKTDAVFGPHVLSEDPQASLSALLAIYQEVLRHSMNLAVSFSFVEISYNHIDQSEVFTDLMDFSGSQPNPSQNLDFSSFSNVVVKSIQELNSLIYIGRKRSKNWLESASDLKTPAYAKSLNKSHLICRLNFQDPREKRQFSFYLIDLIAFERENKGSIEQASLKQINALFDDLISMKEKGGSFQEAKLKARKLLSKTPKNSVSPDMNEPPKMTNMLSNIILSSQTLFYVPMFETREVYNEIIPIIDKCSKMSLIRYTIEKESIEAPKKKDTISYQSFIKYVEAYNDAPVNKTLNLSSATPQAATVTNLSLSPHFSGQVSPINMFSAPDRKEIFIETTGTNRQQKAPSLEKQEYFEFDEMEDLMTHKLNTATFADVAQQKAKFSDYIKIGDERSPQTQQVAGQGRSNQTTPISNSQQKSRAPISRQDSQSSSKGNNNYYGQYKERARETIKIMNGFLLKQQEAEKTGDMPEEYHQLKKNFELLFGLFKEGEAVKQAFMNDFVDLGKSLHDLKEDYDLRLAEIQYQTQGIEKRIQSVRDENNLKPLFDVYEDDIERLSQKNMVLKQENITLLAEVVKFYYPESRFGIPKEYETLIGKHNHLVKQYVGVMKQINEREHEIKSLQRKDRQFVSENKRIEETKALADQVVAELEVQEQISRSLAEQIREYELQNKMLQKRANDQEMELKKLTKGHNKAAEEAFLYSEMADAPSKTFIQTFQKASDSPNQSKLQKSSSRKGMTELDFLVNKLRSMNS